MVDAADIGAARLASPEAFLRRHYGDVAVSRGGRSIRVDHVLRADLKPGGWLSCDWQGGGIGDNVSLVRMTLPGLTFAEAVGELVGGRHGPPSHSPVPLPRTPAGRPCLPLRSHAEEGRSYLWGRGISAAAVGMADLAGALWYCRGGVIFLGRDLGAPGKAVRSATIRYFEPRADDAGRPMTKRDLAHSDKSFPMTIHGEGDLLVVVEGGVNALAALDMSMAGGGPAATVVATGGVGLRHWATATPHMEALVRSVGRVEIWGENETRHDGSPDPEKQAKTDFLRLRLASTVADLRGGEVPAFVYPPPGIKDAADWNLSLATTAPVPPLGP